MPPAPPRHRRSIRLKGCDTTHALSPLPPPASSGSADEINRISGYILANPAAWQMDEENPQRP